MAPAENRLPRLVQGVEVKALPIGPSDAFILACVDGSSTEAEIAAATGISAQIVHDTISRLVALGAVTISEQQKPAARPHRAPMSSASQIAVNTVEEVAVRVEHPGASLYDPAELNEDVDIEPDRRRTILGTFYRLETLNHYELLGLMPQADRKAIRSRYHEIINVFHPDRYYGRRLGSFKAKLERIFQRLTEAHDVLARPETRNEYDAYLNIGQSTRSLERQLNDEEAHARELDRVRARIEAEAGPKEPAIPTAPGAPRMSARPPMASSPVILHSTPPAAPVSSIPVPPASSDPPRSVPPSMDADARRRALARKLGMSSPPPAPRPSPAPAPVPDPTAARERAATDIKRRYDQRMVDARRRQIDEYIARADAALAEHKLVDGVNALRIAASLAPEDVELRQRLDELQAAASKELADRYLEQAQYEEREQHWPEAARSYARALSGKPSARLHERIAHCLLMAHGDLKQAVEQARRAVLTAPNDAKFRQTLARAYVAANMRESALGELERAAALAPSDDTIREQLRRARRGEF